MGSGFDKQPSSRPNVYQNISYAAAAGGTATLVSTKFHASTQHIRVLSTQAGWASVDQSTGSTGISSSTSGNANAVPGGSGFFIPGSTFCGEYFIVTPGQFLTFVTTSATSGYVSITEMA